MTETTAPPGTDVVLAQRRGSVLILTLNNRLVTRRTSCLKQS
jgi:hypothetical protein